MGIYPFYPSLAFLIWQTTQETLNVPLMKAIKTFHQSLKRGFDTETDELNYEFDIVRVDYSICVSDL